MENNTEVKMLPEVTMLSADEMAIIKRRVGLDLAKAQEKGREYARLAEKEANMTTEERIDEIKRAGTLAGLLLETLSCIYLNEKLGRNNAYMMRVKKAIQNK